MVIGNYMEKRCKIININTGREREVVDNSVPCKICDRKFKGELSSELLNRFYKSKISKKVVNVHPNHWE